MTDLAGLVLAGYLARAHEITGTQALVFAGILLVPAPVLARIAKLLGPRGAGAAVALLAASEFLQRVKPALVAVSTAATLVGCSGAQPHLQPITPRLVERAEYGTCAESGGKLTVPQHGTVALLTSVCWLRADAGGAP